MTGTPTPTSVKASATTLRILHLALTASVVIYGVVLHFVLAQPSQIAPKSLDEMLPIVLALAAVAAATVLIAIPVARKRMLPPRRARAHEGDVVPSPLPRAARSAIGRFFTACILTWALCESIAIYGLFLGFLMRQEWIFYPFAGPAVAMMIFFAPRLSDFEAIVRGAVPAEPERY